MNMKKKMEKFFTLARKGNGGFTLVELIVVIAILAILAGVGVPAYSGYIKKADRAADEVLLNSMNKAFASACLINGENNYERKDKPSVNIPPDGKVEGNALSTSSEKVNDSFATFFEGGEFKVITTLLYNPGNGGFVDGEGKMVAEYTYNGEVHTLIVTDEDVDAFLASAFAGEDMGVAFLMGEMDNVVDYAAKYGDKLLTNIKDDPEFKALCEAFPGYATAGEAEKNNIEMQALVQYTASKAVDLDMDAVYNRIMKNPGAPITADSNGVLKTDGDAFAANAAMYALGLTYAKSEEGQAVVAAKGMDPNNLTVEDVRALMTNMDSERDKYGDIIPNKQYNTFGKWLEDNKEETMENLEGFGGAMGMLADNKGNLNADMLITDGYDSTGLIVGLEELLKPAK